MKVNELMIDDWVYNKNIDKPMQIYPMIFSQMFRSNPNATTEDYNIFPIPLTSEILEKNGFRIIFEGDLHISYFYDIESFHIEVKVDKIGIYQKLSMLDGLGNDVTIVECKYVHQLQHVLRLYGIKKEIKL